MEITPTTLDTHLELKLNGRMDAAWTDSVANALAAGMRSGHHSIALNMAGVAYISSAGIRTLVIYSKQLRNIQGRLWVAEASPLVRKVLELAGLDSLLHEHPVETPQGDAKGAPTSRVTLSQPGASAEVFSLAPDASLRLHCPGNPAPWLEGKGQADSCSAVDFPSHVMGLGLGALNEGDASEGIRLGEFLATAGAAICQPADGTNKPDYMLQQGSLTPTMKVAYGILGHGDFSHLVRFDKGASGAGLPLSTLAAGCLDTVGSDAVGIVMVAETASLIGASLQKSPIERHEPDPGGGIFRFPAIRDWLTFTAEAAFANSTTMVVGFAARRSRSASIGLLRPLLRSGELHGHFHAAAFPYHPLRKGRVELAQTIHPMFEGGHVLGLFHLLNDWRETTGAGESRFLRGACWCSRLIL